MLPSLMTVILFFHCLSFRQHIIYRMLRPILYISAQIAILFNIRTIFHPPKRWNQIILLNKFCNFAVIFNIFHAKRCCILKKFRIIVNFYNKKMISRAKMAPESGVYWKRSVIEDFFTIKHLFELHLKRWNGSEYWNCQHLSSELFDIKNDTCQTNCLT